MSRLEKLKNNKSPQLVHERTREESEPRKNSRYLGFVIFLILGGLVYFLFFSGALEISSIEVRGYSNPPLVESVVKNHYKNNFFKSNILLFDSGVVAEDIKGASGVRTVKVRKVLPKKILIEIVESSGVMVLNTAGESFVVDERGYVIDENNIESLLQVYDNANIKTSLGERVASPTFIKYILDLNENFETVVGVKPKKIIIYDIFSDIHVESAAGWTVYLDSTKDPVKQLESLTKVLREAKEEGHSTLTYIDMRLDNKVYYK